MENPRIKMSSYAQKPRTDWFCRSLSAVGRSSAIPVTAAAIKITVLAVVALIAAIPFPALIWGHNTHFRIFSAGEFRQ